MRKQLRLEILPQPDDTTCGPTCLQAVYGYYDDALPLQEVIAQVPPLETGGTLAVFLGSHALARGYQATLYTLNLQIFDPTWFADDGVGDSALLADKLRGQAEMKHEPKLRVATQAYLQFLELGGVLRFQEMRPDLIRGLLKRNVPILTGLSATYLYGCARENAQDKYDDLGGFPTGHFVVVSGYNRLKSQVRVADPLQDNPAYGQHYYTVTMERLIGAILLGILTYDANLLAIEPAAGDPTP